MRFRPLPFKDVEHFDYQSIADDINEYKPEIIWVSLGAPKQEIFMHNLLPYLEQGVMFGFGATFNFNAGTGPVKRAPEWMRRCKLEWLYRALEEPKKNIPRYYRFLRKLPKLIWSEYRQVRHEKGRQDGAQ
jgi:N-acetylglucosaminyldiphosphoundecaprenol N-acetyl-beta-D-mannosaminyltransferase